MTQIEGVQTHLVVASWDDPADPQYLIVEPTMAALPREVLMFFRLPLVIPRTGRDLTARIGSASMERPLVEIHGVRVTPRDMTPGCLHGLMVDSDQARFIQPLHPRPQDFNLVVAWSDNDDLDIANTQGMESFSTPVITWPAYTGSEASSRLLMGVPTDAPDIDRIDRIGGSGGLSNYVQTNDDDRVGGIQYKWFGVSGSGKTRVTHAGRMYRVLYLPYGQAA